MLRLVLEQTRPVASPLFQAIPKRQSTRADYDGRPLSGNELRLLERAGQGRGVAVEILTDRKRLEEVLGFVVRGNTAQMEDPAFVRELKSWIRFNLKTSVERVRRPDQAGVWREATTPQGRSLQGGATSP